MSRGIGKTQQAILDALAADDDPCLTVAELAERVTVSERQIRRAVRSLEDRRLVVITKRSTGQRGVGEYGRLVPRQTLRYNYGLEVSTATVVKKGDPWPWLKGYVAARDLELVHAGMPTNPVLLVWLPDKWTACFNDLVQCENFVRSVLGKAPMSALEVTKAAGGGDAN